MNITDAIDRLAARVCDGANPEHECGLFVGNLDVPRQLEILDEIGNIDLSEALTTDHLRDRMRWGWDEVRPFLAAFALSKAVRSAATELLYERLGDAGDDQEIHRVDWCVDCCGAGEIHCTSCGGSGVVVSR